MSRVHNILYIFSARFSGMKNFNNKLFLNISLLGCKPVIVKTCHCICLTDCSLIIVYALKVQWQRSELTLFFAVFDWHAVLVFHCIESNALDNAKSYESVLRISLNYYYCFFKEVLLLMLLFRTIV